MEANQLIAPDIDFGKKQYRETFSWELRCAIYCLENTDTLLAHLHQLRIDDTSGMTTSTVLSVLLSLPSTRKKKSYVNPLDKAELLELAKNAVYRTLWENVQKWNPNDRRQSD
ncbi:hypothetical protein JTB14_007307 [Gonioctena quinquepunctata]|nr:hypothetical protein JTB14_007307 [Gonioctena quinquepunctata]